MTTPSLRMMRRSVQSRVVAQRGFHCSSSLNDKKKEEATNEEAAKEEVAPKATKEESQEAEAVQEGTTEVETPQAEAPPATMIEIDSKELEAMKSQIFSLNDRVLRSLADIENVRRIARTDVQNAREFAIGKFAKSLLDVADNLQRAHSSIDMETLSAEHSVDALKALHEGVVMTDTQLEKALSTAGIVSMGEVGDVFDPNVHEAMFEFQDDTKKVGSVGQLVKRGYMIHSRVLRPAQVGIVKL